MIYCKYSKKVNVAGNVKLNLDYLTHKVMNIAKCLWYINTYKEQLQHGKDFKQVQISLALYKDKSGIWICNGRSSNAKIELSAS